jgi:hypothetical protein
MIPLDWVKNLFHRPSAKQQTHVIVDDNSVRCIRPDGSQDSLDWLDLQLVAVETNEGGPFVEDVYYYLEGSQFGFYIPQSAHGDGEFIRRILALPGFDHKALSAAMCSTSNERFVCWRKAPLN